MRSVERKILAALRQQGLGPAAKLTARMMRASADNLLVWACVIAATDEHGSGTLRQMAAALPASTLNPSPGLSVVSALVRAIRDRDDYAARRAVERIRRYAPDTNRAALARAIIALGTADQIEPGSDAADRLFQQMHELLRARE